MISSDASRILLMLLLLPTGCTPDAPPVPPAPAAEKLSSARLENLFRVTSNLYSGGSPNDDDAFAELSALGVRSIISVDGAVPDVASAERHGLRYVHLPVGYDGIPTPTAHKLAKAAQSLPGPVYVHCRHGRHRGPAAVAAIRLGLEPDYTPADASRWLEQAGCDPHYQGLHRLPILLPRPTPAQLAAIPDDFTSKARVDDLVRIMIAIDAHWERLQAAKAKDWFRADLAATQLAEDFQDAQRAPAATQKSREFKQWLADAQAAAKDMAQAIQNNNLSEAASLFTKSETLCAKCHAKYRD